MIDRSVGAGLLRREIERRAEDAAGLGQPVEGRVVQVLGDAEIEELGRDDPVRTLCQKDVRGLDVPVDHARAMGGVEGREHGPRDPEGLLEGQAPFAGEALIEVFALEELHRHERRSVVHVRVEDRDDRRVIDLGRRHGFAEEALDGVRVDPEPLRHDLQRDLLAQDLVSGDVDPPHPTFAEWTLDPVLAGDDVSRGEGHGASLPHLRCDRLPGADEILQLVRGVGAVRLPGRPAGGAVEGAFEGDEHGLGAGRPLVA